MGKPNQMTPMSDEVLRVKVAELAGWKREMVTYRINGQDVGRELWTDPKGASQFWEMHRIPNYPASIDAVRDAILQQPAQVQNKVEALAIKRSTNRNCNMIALTARDWCECLLAAKGQT